MFQDLQDIFDLDQIIPSIISIQPPSWFISLDINLKLHQLPKKNTNTISQAQLHTQIFTDTSITNQKVGAEINIQFTQPKP